MHFLKMVFGYNWMQFSSRANKFCHDILKEEKSTDLLIIPSRYMQLILCGKRKFKNFGAVLTTILISFLSIFCAIAEDVFEFAMHAMIISLIGRIICCIVFLFQFDMLFDIDKRKILMLTYLFFAFFIGSSFCVHLIFLIIFNFIVYRIDYKEDLDD